MSNKVSPSGLLGLHKDSNSRDPASIDEESEDVEKDILECRFHPHYDVKLMEDPSTSGAPTMRTLPKSVDAHQAEGKLIDVGLRIEKHLVKVSASLGELSLLASKFSKG